MFIVLSGRRKTQPDLPAEHGNRLKPGSIQSLVLRALCKRKLQETQAIAFE